MHRLAGYDIQLPPLRDRREDIGCYFISSHVQELEADRRGAPARAPGSLCQPWLPAGLAARLVRYAWPGNIRELRNLTRPAGDREPGA